MAEKPESKTEEPEEIEAIAESHADGVMDALDKNRNLILGGIAVAAIAICAFLVFGQLGKQKHLEAGAAYTSAASARDIAALDAVAVDFPGSIPAGNALLMKSEVQIDQGKSQDAIATLEKFLSEYGTHPQHAQGNFALGNLHQNAGDAAKAKEFYEKVIAEQPDAELTPLTRIRLGDLALAAGEVKKADQHYQESFTLHPGNPFMEYAEEKIAMLKVGNPTEVDRPEPPKPKVEPKPATAPEAGANVEKPATKPTAVKPKAAEPKGNAPAAAAKGGKAKAPQTTPAAPKAKAKSNTPKPNTAQKGKGQPKPAPKGRKANPNQKSKAKAPNGGKGKSKGNNAKKAEAKTKKAAPKPATPAPAKPKATEPAPAPAETAAPKGNGE